MLKHKIVAVKPSKKEISEEALFGLIEQRIVLKKRGEQKELDVLNQKIFQFYRALPRLLHIENRAKTQMEQENPEGYHFFQGDFEGRITELKSAIQDAY